MNCSSSSAKNDEEEFESSSSNFFISTVLNAFPVSGLSRVLSADQLANYHGQTGQFFFVVNLSESSELGTHFVLIAKQGLKLFYLDPLKLGFVLNEHIPLFLASFPDCTVCQLKARIQPVDSWFCAFYCLNFVYMLNKKTSGLPYESLELVDLKKNDCRAINNLMLVFQYFWEKE